ncbi:MAG: hypothetical protein M3R38_35025 [Actinomycetota bacterium]|nr:hypothetical protein [Actinomycetota bacterium]
MTEQATKTEAERLLEEERKMDAEVGRLEAEQRELDSPARVLTWDEIQAGATEDLTRREARRGIIPMLITAAKVKRLELRRERYEGDVEPLRKLAEEAYERLQAATAKRLQAVEEEDAARYEYADPQTRLDNIGRRTKEIDREIRALRGGG